MVERDGMLIMRDDERMKLRPGEVIENRLVRFRTLGCYPLTGAIDSDAADLESIVNEILIARTSERQGRLIDRDGRLDGKEKALRVFLTCTVRRPERPARSWELIDFLSGRNRSCCSM